MTYNVSSETLNLTHPLTHRSTQNTCGGETWLVQLVLWVLFRCCWNSTLGGRTMMFCRLSLHHEHFIPHHHTTPNTTKTKVIWLKAESLTPHLYSPGGSIGLTFWLQFAITCFGCRFFPLLPFQLGPGIPSNTLDSTSAKWDLNPSNGWSRVHECDRRQTDRQPRKNAKSFALLE